MKSPLEQFREFAACEGLRLTRSREDVVRAAFALDDHFNTDDLLRVLRRRRLHASRVTVYRTLPLLIRAGLIRKALPCAQNEQQLYEHVWGLPHHDHLVCEVCGRIVEFADQRIERAQRRVAEEYGFALNRHTLELRGVCGDCSANPEVEQ
ncbi:MAG: Fur family transcriptional regulator [Candidatus Alcyoniella australis]|nr:Fur family transcriptional regulator [Candidatus Alcyoniella australis]